MIKVDPIGSDTLSMTPPVDFTKNTNPVSFSEKLDSIDRRIVATLNGKDVDVASLMIDIESAKLKIEQAVVIRDKAIDAYKEITKMQV